MPSAESFLDEKPSAESFLDSQPSAEEFLGGSEFVDTRAQWDELTRQIEARDNAPIPPTTIGQALKEGWKLGLEEAGKSPLGLPAKALAFVPHPSKQTVQNAMDVLGAAGLAQVGTPESSRTAKELLFRPDQPPSEAAKAAAGGLEVARQVPEMLASPVGVATLGMGTVPRIGQRLISAGFLGETIANTPEAAQRAGAASVTGDEQEKVEAYGGLGLNAILAPTMGLHALSRTPVPETFPALPNPDAVARNLAAPGTLRPQEVEAFGAPEVPKPEMFELGEIPFDASRRMGNRPLPPVEILPRMGRIENVPILEELRPKEQLETRGKVSFGAEAPTLLRNSIEQAREVGLTKSAEALEQVAKGESKMPPYQKPKEFTAERAAEQERKARKAAPEEGLYMEQPPMEPLAPEVGQFPAEPGMPEGTLSRLQSSRIQAGKQNVRSNVRNNPPEATNPKSEAARKIEAQNNALGLANDLAVDVRDGVKTESQGRAMARMAGIEHLFDEMLINAKNRKAQESSPTTAAESRANAATKTPEQIATELEAVRAEMEAMEKPGADATPEQRLAYLTKKTELANKAGFLKEGADVQKEKGIISGTAAESWADGVLRGGGTHLGPDVIAAYAIKGAAIIERGVRDFAKWSEEMVNKHGPEIKAHLKDIYAQSMGLIDAESRRTSQPRERVFGVETRKVEAPISPRTEPAPKPVNPDLADIYKIFEPEPVKKPTIGERAKGAYESVRTGLSSKFRPLNKLAEDIAKQYGGKAKDVAAIFEQVKGASGKSQADIYRFDESMKPIRGSEKDFNAYLFLRRGLDRLNQDLKDIQTAQAVGNVPKLNRRSVGDYTIRDLESKLKTLEQQIGPEKLAEFEKAADAYQTHLNEALALQVSSGRMSPEVYRAIKSGNQFYAPFKMLKYIEQTTRPEGTGNAIQTLADYTKAMEGIESKEFKLGDMLAAARQNIALSRVLAEKNKAMREVSELAKLDSDGLFIRKLAPGTDAPKGYSDISVLENGKPQRYAVNDTVAQAVKFDEKLGGIIPRMAANVFRFGATVGNIPFQISNLLADVPRQALVSKFGVQIIPDLLLYPFDKFAGRETNIPRSAVQSMKYPLDFLEAIYSSMVGDVVGPKNKLMLDFLDSGAAGTSIQEYLTPDALRGTSKPEGVAKKVALAPIRGAMAIEQVSKLTGVKRAMRERGIESAKDLSPEDVTEIRRFSGSPDFGRIGKWTEKYGLNVAEMFLNARIQGAVADVGRLKGRDGVRAAAATWINLGSAVGIPTLILYLKNHETEEDSKSIDARSDQERKNYWLLPKHNEDGTPKMIQTPQGPVRDYWRIPKRESSKWMANFVEAGLDFSRQKDPETFKKWAVGMLEEITPVNVSGNTMQERGESVISGLNPLAKAPIEATIGRDTYRHRDIIPKSMEKASPEQQFTERTPELFKRLAVAVPDVAPEMLRSPLMLENMTKNLTAGLVTQFLPRKPVEGRSKLENTPLLQRFQALPFLDDSDFDERMKAYERESNDEQLARFRKAREIADQFKSEKTLVGAVPIIKGDPALAEKVVDLWLADKAGITVKERRIIALPASERAKYVMDELNGKTPDEKATLLNDLRRKRILTESVANEMEKLKPETKKP